MRTPAPLSLDTVARLIGTVFPRHRVVDAQLLAGGLCNTNLKVRLDPPAPPLVLRIYVRDPSACRKEMDLLELVRRTVPVPEVLGVAAAGIDEIGPFAVLRFVEGPTFRELRATGDAPAIAAACDAIGRTLAAIGQYTFPRPGRLEAGPRVGEQLVAGPDPIPTFLDTCLAHPALGSRVDAPFRERIHALVWSWADRLREATDDRRLVHCDYGTRNLILRETAGRWGVAAVLDWEFAAAGSPLWDVGHFLRYDRPGRPPCAPSFSGGFLAGGGTLPDQWRRLARLVDLVALCEALTWATLPDDVTREIVELVRATVEDRDPVLM
jgi:aminoglycoside phosphotransferase (APT) family kinase protein